MNFFKSLLKNDKIIVAVIGGLSVLGAAWMTNNPGKNSTETNTANSYNQSGGITAGKIEIDSPAQYSETHATSRQSDGKYLTTITVTANKRTNLPRELCVRVNSDVPTSLPGLFPIYNYQKASSQVRAGNDIECIDNPSETVVATFIQTIEPKYFHVGLDY